MNDRPIRQKDEKTAGHVLDRIQACLDGELSPVEEKRVRDHVRDCAPCEREWAEAEALHRLLDTDRPSEPLRPFWPELEHRLARRIGTPMPVRVGAALAIAAGLLIGLYLPTMNSPADSDGPWSDVGTILSDSGGGGLADMYLLASVSEEEDTP